MQHLIKWQGIMYDVINVLNQNDKYGIMMTIWDGLGKEVNTSWDWKLMLLKDL